MPTYTYECPNGHRDTRIRGMAFRDHMAICREPGCFEDMERVPDAPAFALKGSGFHAVDYPKERRRGE